MIAYSMSGCIDSISINNCNIGKWNAYAINSICETLYSISIENTVINMIESQALKKLNIEHFTVLNCTVLSHLPSRTFSALTITNEISIANCSFTTIASHAIELDGMYLYTYYLHCN